MRRMQMMSVLAGVVLAGGCSTVPDPYIPQTMGDIDDRGPIRGLNIEIVPRTDEAVIGSQLHVDVEVANVGTEPFWIPKSPQILLVWVYPNGRRDNFCDDPCTPEFRAEDECRQLRPGERFTQTIPVKTYYFPRQGITEFRAVMNVAPCTNPGIQPFWAGSAVSDAYGVMLLDQGLARSRKSVSDPRRMANLHFTPGS